MLANITFAAEPNQYRGAFGPGTQPYLDELDRVLAKLRATGPGSLSSEERAFLNRFSDS